VREHRPLACSVALTAELKAAGVAPHGFPSQGDLNAANGLSALGLAVPALIGMFWGRR
jgi:hypothetical protein